MKTGERYIFRFCGKRVIVRIVQILDYGVECEFLQDCDPAKNGERMICNTAALELLREGDN